MLSREAALAFGRYGITVNIISPGSTYVPPRANKSRITKTTKGRDVFLKNRPESGFLSGRVGNPADIGYYAVFLADERSQFITGSSIRADGGAGMF
jgi:NAD(P)-dependent dehydrogenase (short-subunit alcohol dehydrogenase family)